MVPSPLSTLTKAQLNNGLSDMQGVKVAIRSEKGLVRKDNQDGIACLEAAGVFAVADGMGGGVKGALASQMMCEALEKGVSPASDYMTRLDEIAKAVVTANSGIFSYADSQRLRAMGTTLALLALDELSRGRGAIAHIGDSRVYRVRGGDAELMTRDHSVGSELAEKVGAAIGHGFAMRSNPLSHVLTRAVGTAAKVQLEWRKIDIAVGDRFVVCSDGVHDVVDIDELPALVQGVGVEDAAVALERRIVSRGAPDNYSFIILDIGGQK